MTFRVTKIPGDLDLPRLSQVVKDIFELGKTEFEIHSLASDASDETEPWWKAATITFRVRPTLLKAEIGTPDEWLFDLPSVVGTQSACGPIHFDTHFNGFTPLSPAEKDSEHTIEYDFPNVERKLAN